KEAIDCGLCLEGSSLLDADCCQMIMRNRPVRSDPGSQPEQMARLVQLAAMCLAEAIAQKRMRGPRLQQAERGEKFLGTTDLADRQAVERQCVEAIRSISWQAQMLAQTVMACEVRLAFTHGYLFQLHCRAPDQQG